MRSTGETTGGVSNTGVAVSAMSKANTQGVIYDIKIFKKIWSICMHADVEITKVRKMYHHWDMEEAHEDP